MKITENWRGAVIASSVAGVVVAGAVIPALAQDDTGTGDATGETTEEATTREELRAGRHEAFAGALAAELDIDQERIEEALANVRDQLREQRRERAHQALTERLDEAVEDGELTQEQVDAILEAAEDGVLPLGRRGHHGPRGWGGGPPADGDISDS